MIDKITEQKLQSCLMIGNELLIKNGLNDWKLKINRKRSAIAQTAHDQKTIYYSKYFLMITDKSQLEGITLHEIAHALLGYGYGHSSKFIKLCKKISPTSLYARSSINIPIRKYIATCPICGYSGSYNRNDKALYCAKCCKKGIIAKFIFTKNDTKVLPL